MGLPLQDNQRESEKMTIVKTIFKAWTLGFLGVVGVLIIGFLAWSVWAGLIQPRTTAGATCLLESRCVYTIVNGRGSVQVLGYAPDGSRLLSRGSDTLIHDAATGDRIRRLNPSFDGSFSVQFMGDWPEIAVIGQEMIEFYDYDGELKRTWRADPDERTSHFAALPNVNGFALAQEEAIAFYSLSDGSRFTQLPHSAGMSLLSASHDGEILGAYHADTEMIHVWPLSSINEARTIPATGRVRDLQVSADGSLVAWHVGSAAFVTQTAGGGLLLTAAGIGDIAVTALSLAVNGEQLAVGFADGSVEIWSIENQAIEQLLEHPRQLSRLALSPDGNYLAVGLQRNAIVTFPDEYVRQQQLRRQDRPNQPISRNTYPVSERQPGFAIVWSLSP
jgi:WD40 repeat protein